MSYGDKRNNRKIDLYVQVNKSDAYAYAASTTWAKTCKEAKEHFLTTRHDLRPSQVHAMFA